MLFVVDDSSDVTKKHISDLSLLSEKEVNALDSGLTGGFEILVSDMTLFDVKNSPEWSRFYMVELVEFSGYAASGYSWIADSFDIYLDTLGCFAFLIYQEKFGRATIGDNKIGSLSPSTALHEVGHLVDLALGMVSLSPEFGGIYDRYIAIFNISLYFYESSHYNLPPEQGGLTARQQAVQEFFAEWFARWKLDPEAVREELAELADFFETGMYELGQSYIPVCAKSYTSFSGAEEERSEVIMKDKEKNKNK